MGVKVRINPIQQNYRAVGKTVTCGLCSTVSTPRLPDTPPRVTHMVHLVRDHLGEVEYANSAKGQKEDITVDLEEV